MDITSGKFFGEYKNDTIDNLSAAFWNDVKDNFLGEKSLEKRIWFFQKYGFDYQTEYKPSIPFYYVPEDLNKFFLYYEQELKKEGINAPYPNNEDLLNWYLKQDLKVEKSEMSILDQRNYVTIHNRFKLNISPHSTDSKFDRELYNQYLEIQILEYYPQHSFSSMMDEFEKKKVHNKKIQIETTLKLIEAQIKEYQKFIDTPPKVNDSARMIANLLNFHHGDGDDFISDHAYFLEGYHKCRSEGFDHWPYKTKITLDYIKGKNIAWFEMLLSEMLETSLVTLDQSKSPHIKLKWTGQKNQLYAILRQLKNEYEMLNNSYNELADFIKLYVVGFENTSKETIEKELKKNTVLPKAKRVKLDTP